MQAQGVDRSHGHMLSLSNTHSEFEITASSNQDGECSISRMQACHARKQMQRATRVSTRPEPQALPSGYSPRWMSDISISVVLYQACAHLNVMVVGRQPGGGQPYRRVEGVHGEPP